MRALLDTCVLSEIRRTECDPSVRSTVDSIRSRDLFLSVITLGELSKGITLLSAGKRKKALRGWLMAIERDFEERILPIDLETAEIWGELCAVAHARGKRVPVADGLIAASAIRHGLHLMTRNTRDFGETGALVLNPWEPA